MQKKLIKNNFILEAKNLTRRFSRRTVFNDICFSIQTGDSLAITGPNGSGKSTLLEIAGGLQRPTWGSVHYTVNGKDIASKFIRDNIGFVSPKINPYNELTGLENINFILGTEKIFFTEVNKLLDDFDLYKDRNKSLKHYSSGMKQRLKFAFALFNDPKILLLDEPGSNLDETGLILLNEIIETQRKRGILILATNDKRETKYGDEILNLDESGTGVIH